MNGDDIAAQPLPYVSFAEREVTQVYHDLANILLRGKSLLNIDHLPCAVADDVEQEPTVAPAV
jgi:hypothetical protein